MTGGLERACREASEWHILLHEEPDDPDLRAGFAQWHDADACHAEAWQSMNHTFRTIVAVGDESGAGDPQVIAHRMRSGSRSWVRRSLAGLAAVCVVLLVAMQAPDLFVKLSSDYATAAAETEEVVLADGSTVRLAPETAIAVAFTDERRDVRLLSGMAYFEVAPNPDRPFAVTANGITATVMGTAFDVGTYGGGASVEVRNGHVRVGDSEGRQSEAADLHAGDWARVDANGRMTTGHVSPDLVGDWWSGRLMVRGQSIAEVIDQIRPWFSGTVVLLNGALGERRVTGVYDPRNPATALEALVSPYGGRVTRVTPWALIVSAG